MISVVTLIITLVTKSQSPPSTPRQTLPEPDKNLPLKLGLPFSDVFAQVPKTVSVKVNPKSLKKLQSLESPNLNLPPDP